MQVMNHTDLRALFDQQHQASRRQVEVPLVVRRERLLRIQKLLEEHGRRWPLPCRLTLACAHPSSRKWPI